MKDKYCKTGRLCEDCNASQYRQYPDGEYYVSGCNFGLINYAEEMSWNAFAEAVVRSYEEELDDNERR